MTCMYPPPHMTCMCCLSSCHTLLALSMLGKYEEEDTCCLLLDLSYSILCEQDFNTAGYLLPMIERV